MTMQAGSALRQLVEHVLYGPYKDDYRFVSGVVSCLEKDARAAAAGPASYFVFQPSAAPGHPSPILVPNIPSRPPDSGSGARGWAFACWLRLPAPAKPFEADLTKAVRPSSSLLARFATKNETGAIASDIEVWLSPTDTPQIYKITLKSTTPGTGAFRGRRVNQVNVNIKVPAMTWHHIAISQTDPRITMVKPAKVCVYLDGKLLLDTELPCPTLPFSSAVFGANLDGALAHPQLYGERMPAVHVAALARRGPNAPTLHHSLVTVPPTSAPPDIARTGAVIWRSMEDVHNGIPTDTSFRNNPYCRGALPPLLLHLDAWMTFTPGSGGALVADEARSQVAECAAAPLVHEKIPFQSVCPITSSKGAASGVAALNDKKRLPAMICSEVTLRSSLHEDDPSSPEKGSFSTVALIGAGARAVLSADESEDNEPAVRANTLLHWRACGGITKVLELMASCPVETSSHADSSPAAFRRAFSDVCSAEALAYLSHHLAECDHSSTHTMDNSTILTMCRSLACAGNGAAIALYLSLLSNLLTFDYNLREEMFQLRGFEILDVILRKLISDPKWACKPTSQNHPVSMAVWTAAHALLQSTKYWEDSWNGLFCRGVRFLLCDWQLWTSNVPVPAFSAVSAKNFSLVDVKQVSLREKLNRAASEAPAEPLVLLGWSQYVSDLVFSSPHNFFAHTKWSAETACEAFLNILRSTALSFLQSQLQSLASVVPDLKGLSGATARVPDTISMAEFATQLSQLWIRTLAVIFCVSLGEAVPVDAAMTIDERRYIPPADDAATADNVKSIIALIGRLCEEHLAWHSVQSTLSALWPANVSDRFPALAPYGIDPFSIACTGMLDFAHSLIRSFPAKVFHHFDQQKGPSIAVACATAECEVTRVAAMDAVAATIALRRMIATAEGKDSGGYVKEMQVKLLRILHSALSSRMATTGASIFAALGLALSADVSPRGLVGLASQFFPQWKSSRQAALSGSPGGLPASSDQSMLIHRRPSAIKDVAPPAPPLFCAEALPTVFLLLSLASARLKRLFLCATSTAVVDALEGICEQAFTVDRHAAVEAECQRHVEALRQLTSFLPSRSPNIRVVLRQPSWQIWFLNLTSPNAAARGSGPALFNLSEEHRFLTDSLPIGAPAHLAAESPAVDAPTDIGVALLGTDRKLACAAKEIMTTMLTNALELDSGWRVWMSTINCVVAYHKKMGIDGFALQSSFGETLGALVADVFNRLSREKAKLASHLRVNFVNTLGICCCKLGGGALRAACASAIPLIRELRARSRVAAAGPPGANAATDINPLTQQEVWIIIEFLAAALPALVGYDEKGWFMESGTQRQCALISAPNISLLQEALTLLQQFVDDEAQSLPAMEDREMTSTMQPRLLDGAPRSLMQDSTISTPVAARSTPSMGSRVDALLVVASALAKTVDACVLVAQSCEAFMPPWVKHAEECQEIAGAFAISLLNNQRWGNWQGLIDPLTDIAYMHGRGKAHGYGRSASMVPSTPGSMPIASHIAATPERSSSIGLSDVAFSPTSSELVGLGYSAETASVAPFLHDRVQMFFSALLQAMQMVFLMQQGRSASLYPFIKEIERAITETFQPHPACGSKEEVNVLTKYLQENLQAADARPEPPGTDMVAILEDHWHAVRVALSRPSVIGLRQRFLLLTEDYEVRYRSDAAGALDALYSVGDDVPTSGNTAVDKPVKVDSHERQGRGRLRLCLTDHEPLRALTYTEYGKLGGREDDAMRKLTAEKARAALNATGDEFSKKLAKAGAINNVVEATKDEGESQITEEDGLSLASQPTDDPFSDVRSEVRAASERDTATLADDDDEASNAADGASVEASAEEAVGLVVPQKADEQLSNYPRGGQGQTKVLASLKASMVKQSGYAPGLFSLHATGMVVWEPLRADQINVDDENAHLPDPDAVAPPRRVRKWHLRDMCGLLLRCYRLMDCAMEAFLLVNGGPRRRRYFFTFEGGRAERDSMVQAIYDFYMMWPNLHIQRNLWDAINACTPNGCYFQLPRSVTMISTKVISAAFTWDYIGHFKRVAAPIILAWQQRRLSNFDYLMTLNTLAGRTFNDLTQYPVFPWVISDYTSDTLDLANPASYRDLQRPMGALNAERLKEFRSRYDTFDDEAIPKFLYGSHYSTAVGTVVHWLLRLYPFTRIHLAYQDGHFDVADRLFTSVRDAWDMNTHQLSEVKELTPEWYSNPHFLMNHSAYKFGLLQDGTAVDHVRLPPWASSAASFVSTLRAALESEWVSHQLHHWIDLVFGYKQRGHAAADANNVFYYLTYAGGVDLEAIDEPALRKATQLQISHYGQTPLQLLRDPHPPRGPPPTMLPPPISPTPWAAALERLDSGSIEQGTKKSDSDRRKSAKGSGLKHLVNAVKVNVAAAAEAIAYVRPAYMPGLRADTYRPLITDLRALAAVHSGVSRQSCAASTTQTLKDLRASMCALNFRLVPSASFSHVCTVEASGISVWKPDAPCKIPVGLRALFGAFRETGGESDILHFAFGDVMVQGSSAAPATLLLRVPLCDVDKLIDIRGKKATAWPRAFPDRYTTSPTDAYTKHSDVSSGFCGTPLPFAFPIDFHLVCELRGEGNVPLYSGNAPDDDDDSETITSTSLSQRQYHVWWPVAPSGYVALGAIVTPDTIVSTSTAVGRTEDGRIRRTTVTRIRPTPPSIGAVVCPHFLLCERAALDVFAPLHPFALNIPPQPREEQLIMRGWNKKAADTSRQSRSNTGTDVLRGWSGALCDGTSTSISEGGPDRVLAPEDEWVILRPEGSAPAAHPTAKATSAVDAAEADAASTPSLDTEADFSPSPSQLAVKQATRAFDGVACYSVKNRVHSFAIPCPVSVQSFEVVQSRLNTGGHTSQPSTTSESDIDALLGLAFASASVSSGKPVDARTPHYVLASTPIPPAPEWSDSVFHKAFHLCASVAYDFIPDISTHVSDDRTHENQHWSVGFAQLSGSPIVAMQALRTSSNTVSSVPGTKGFSNAVQPSIVLALAANGELTVCNVTAKPTYSTSEVANHVTAVSASVASFMALPGTIGDIEDPILAADSRCLIPHARIALDIAKPASTLIPLAGFRHKWSNPPITTYPVTLGRFGGSSIAITGVGRMDALEMYLLSTKEEQPIKPTVLDSRKSVTTNSILINGPGGRAASTTSAAESLGVPLCAPGISICSITTDSETIGVGFSDGSVGLWQLTRGKAGPALQARPEKVLRGACFNPVKHVSLSLNDDVAVVTYEQEVWVFEVARSRPTQCLLAVNVKGSAASFVGSAVACDAGVLVAANLLEGAYIQLFSNALAVNAALACTSERKFDSKISTIRSFSEGGFGDVDGAGRVIAVGFITGQVVLVDGRTLDVLISWRTHEASAITSIEISPDLSYMVVGTAEGSVEAFALPSFCTSVPLASDITESTPGSLVAGAVSVSVTAANRIASEATSVVRGLFGSLLGGGDKSKR